MKRLAWIVVGLGLLLSLPAAAADSFEDIYEPFLSRDRIGARDFVRKHGEWDGRGRVVLAVLDTGVDMSVPGLVALPDGTMKVIEARDFSGQGDLTLTKATAETMDGKAILRGEGGYLLAPTKLPEMPIDGNYWLGFLKEERWRRSEVRDVNGNGETDDVFAFLVVRGGSWQEPVWFVYADTDMDGSVDDEEPVRDYLADQKTIVFGGADPAKKSAALVFAPTVLFEGPAPELSLHFTDGAHGTHCAGISAGYRIHGQDGFHGMAPGARILSLKIGNNTFAGGCTTTESMKKAFEYAGRWTVEHGDFVVINLSYGIGSEMEASHDIDVFVDDLLRRYPRLALATSAGNSGPGLSTVGTPAGATLAFSTGALLTTGNARDLYGVKLGRDRLFSFSSRGGELDKPDGLAPGCAWSTVPDWEHYQIFRGTSMASPQVAGAMLLLASAADAEGLDITNGMLRRALRYTGQSLPDTPAVCQGGGVVDVPAAYEALKRFAGRKEAAKAALGFAIETATPSQPDGGAPAAYWRAGGYAPESPLGQVFSVKAMLPKTWSADEREAFHETYNLKPAASWVSVDRRSVALRGELASQVTVSYDTSKLREPGIHTARVIATPAKASSKRTDTAFELTSTVIVPERVGREDDYRLKREGQKLPLGELKRWFVMVPPGTTTLDLRVTATKGQFAFGRVYLFDPAGHQLPAEGYFVDSETKEEGRYVVRADDLVPGGIYEALVYGEYRRYGSSGKTSTFDLELSFGGLDFEGPDFVQSPGAAPEGTALVTNAFDDRFVGTGKAWVEGYERAETVDVEGDEFTHSFSLGAGVSSALFILDMTPEDYALFTDVAVQILDAGGNPVAMSGFTATRAVIHMRGGPGNYTLQVVGGRTHAKGRAYSLTMLERYYYSERVPATVTSDDAGTFALYPGVPASLEVSLAAAPTQAPDDFVHTGRLQLIDREGRRWHDRRFTFGPLELME